jgi:hypothetical protein
MADAIDFKEKMMSDVVFLPCAFSLPSFSSLPDFLREGRLARPLHMPASIPSLIPGT